MRYNTIISLTFIIFNNRIIAISGLHYPKDDDCFFVGSTKINKRCYKTNFAIKIGFLIFKLILQQM